MPPPPSNLPARRPKCTEVMSLSAELYGKVSWRRWLASAAARRRPARTMATLYGVAWGPKGFGPSLRCPAEVRREIRKQ
jgi:hypothetical protein